jgi:hypothetical protein
VFRKVGVTTLSAFVAAPRVGCGLRSTKLPSLHIFCTVAVLGWLAAAPGYGSGGSSTDGNVAAGILQSRIRYFDTAQDLTPDLNFNSQPHLLYNPATKRFFVADAEQNHVLVYDATVESQVADIVVPGAWALDQSQDQKIVYVGTQVGNIYLIDPVAMTVTQVIPASAIGPSGYPTYAVRALADGRLALLGGQGGFQRLTVMHRLQSGTRRIIRSKNIRHNTMRLPTRLDR